MIDKKIIHILEDLFNMSTGYVMDFSNNTFEIFIYDSIKVNIYKDYNYLEYESKANKLRKIFRIEPIEKQLKLCDDLIDYYEDLKMKKNTLTEYDSKKIKQVREYINMNKKGNIYISDELNEKIRKISTRNAYFQEMPIDEKLELIVNLIENILKENENFIKLEYEENSCGFLNDEIIKNFRKKLQCFRHSKNESINERKTFTKIQKEFMLDFGITICKFIYNLKNNIT